MRTVNLTALSPLIGALAVFGGCDSKPQPPAAEASATAKVASTAAPRDATQAGQASAPGVAPQAPADAPAAAESGSRPQQPVYADYRPPISQPETIAVPWAPPPMRVESPAPRPAPDAVWTGGYWVWHEGWSWAPGRWAEPPRPRYHWVPPYYEHRHDRVLFVDGFWSPPGVAFAPPPPNLSIALAVVGAGILAGRPAIGPEGSFVPPPPGSRLGLIVPAPPGTAPAVVMHAPAIVEGGMRVTRGSGTGVGEVRDTTIVDDVTIVAPASATADHRDVRLAVPAQARLAAATRSVEGARAEPASPPASEGKSAEPSRDAPAQSDRSHAASQPERAAHEHAQDHDHDHDRGSQPEVRHQAPPPAARGPASDVPSTSPMRHVRPEPAPKDGVPATHVYNRAPLVGPRGEEIATPRDAGSAQPSAAPHAAPARPALPPHAPSANAASSRPGSTAGHPQPETKDHARTPQQKKAADEPE